MRLIDADELCNRLLERWKTADKNKEELIKRLMADVVTPIVVGTPTVCDIDAIRECKQYVFETNGERYFKVDEVLQIIDRHMKGKVYG